MDGELYFTLQIDPETTLSISPIAEWEIETSGEVLNDSSGYFLVETRRSKGPEEVRILARLTSEETALELSQMLNMR